MTITNQQRIKATLISSIGGSLEIYDFTIYIFFAPIFAALFFPAHDPFITLLNTFSVFAVGYFARPLGAIIFGHFGDKFGRKKGMLLSIAIMAISTTAIGLLPSYLSIGAWASTLLVLFRFLQGFAVGGDLPGAITFVAEYAEPQKRGLYCSLVYCAVNIGLLLASLIGALLTSFLSHQYLLAWGWRIAFLLGIVIGIIGFYLRSKIAETSHFKQLEQAQKIVNIPLLQLFKVHYKEVLQGIGLVWFFAVIISQIFLYMPTYLTTVAHVNLNHALIINSFNIFILCFFIPISGYLSDKIGRKPIIMMTALLFSLLTYPLYSLILQQNFLLEIAALFSFSLLAAGIIGTVPATLAEMFATNVRYSGVALTYNIGFAIFAGLTPMVATFLLYHYGATAPSFNLILSSVIALIVSFSMKDHKRESFHLEINLVGNNPQTSHVK